MNQPKKARTEAQAKAKAEIAEALIRIESPYNPEQEREAAATLVEFVLPPLTKKEMEAEAEFEANFSADDE